MKLPNFEHAIIPEHKIIGYLLSLSHRDGRGKAVFFLRFGFSSDAWQGRQKRYGDMRPRTRWFESRIHRSGIVTLSKDQSQRQTAGNQSFG